MKKLNNGLQQLPTNVDELISKKRTKKSKSSPMSCSLVDQISNSWIVKGIMLIVKWN